MSCTAIAFARVALAGACCVAAVPCAVAGLTVRLEPQQRFYYEGDPVTLRLAVRNSGDAPVRNPLRKSVTAALEIRDEDGRALEARAAREAAEADAPREIAPGGTYETSIDLGGVDALRHAGRYELRWTAVDPDVEAAEVVILPRYDPSLQYVARLDTDLGPIDIRLFGSVSPVAVRVFVDLARAGFYDGTPFHETLPGSYVGAGDPRLSRDGQLLFPAEQSEVIVVPGTVVMKPVSPAPPSNGTAFLISLRPQPGWTGQLTVIGQVVSGLDVVEQISRLAPAGAATQTGARIRSMRIDRAPSPEGPR